MKNPIAKHYQKLRGNQKPGKQALCAIMRKIALIARALGAANKSHGSRFYQAGACEKLNQTALNYH